MTLAFDALEAVDSWLGRRDPRWKLVALAAAVTAVAALQTLPPVAVALGSALTLAGLGRLPVRWLLRRLATVAVLLAPFALLPLLPDDGPAWSLGPVRVSLNGLGLALLLTGKALTVTTLVLSLAATSPLPTTLKAAQALRVPGLLVQLIALTYRYVFVLAEELGRLRIALRVRGFRGGASLHSYRTVGQVTGVLLLRGSERAERVGQAIRCRGFDGRFRSLTDFRTTAADVVLFGLITVIAAALFAWDWSLR